MEAANRLNLIIKELTAQIGVFSESELGAKPKPEKWSKKEILGHLCDSALTNLQRFIRVHEEPRPYLILTYAQNDWVKRMDYQHLPAEHILNLWVSLNTQIAHVMSLFSGDELNFLCADSQGNTFTLEWLANDYVDHLEHHLKQIFDRV